MYSHLRSFNQNVCHQHRAIQSCQEPYCQFLITFSCWYPWNWQWLVPKSKNQLYYKLNRVSVKKTLPKMLTLDDFNSYVIYMHGWLFRCALTNRGVWGWSSDWFRLVFELLYCSLSPLCLLSGPLLFPLFVVKIKSNATGMW